ncbi:MAG: tol-pal system protein YbgF [Desulfobacteraceae bacterium]|nr:tol-pal system protein YbgF [Desulfobacteraceae bacterium]
MSKFFYFAVFLICCLIFCSGCVASSKIDILENRVISLEMEKTRQIKTTQNQENEIKELKKKYASLKAELRSYRAAVQRLKGIIEETGHKFTALDKKKGNESKDNQKDKQIEELNNKVFEISKHIVELEQYIGLESTKNLPDQPSTKPESDTEPDDSDDSKVINERADDPKIDEEEDIENPEAIYKNAKSLLDKEEYDAARLEFEKFINLFPDSKNADNARFWIADTYYREKWYEKSILEYQKVIEKYSKGNKVAAALLKQGYSFAELGEKANARLILKELIKKYPDSKEAGFAVKKLESLK